MRGLGVRLFDVEVDPAANDFLERDSRRFVFLRVDVEVLQCTQFEKLICRRRLPFPPSSTIS